MIKNMFIRLFEILVWGILGPPLLIKLLFNNNEIIRDGIFRPTFAPTNLEVIKILWHVRAHPRTAALKRVSPSRPRACDWG